jgi:anti-sigma B factor antagonist
MDHHPDSSVSARSVEPGVRVVEVVGEFDLALRPAFNDALAKADGHVEVDLGAVSFLDSAGIAALVEGRKAALDRGASFRVTEASDTVIRMLDITGLLDTLGIAEPQRRRSAS